MGKIIKTIKDHLM